MKEITIRVAEVDYTIIEEMGRTRGESPEACVRSASLWLAFHDGIIHRLVREGKVPKSALGPPLVHDEEPA